MCREAQARQEGPSGIRRQVPVPQVGQVMQSAAAVFGLVSVPSGPQGQVAGFSYRFPCPSALECYVLLRKKETPLHHPEVFLAAVIWGLGTAGRNN